MSEPRRSSAAVITRTGAFERSVTIDCKHPAYYPGEPKGYVAWFDWAEKKSKTHDQLLCPHCKRYAIWKCRRS